MVSSNIQKKYFLYVSLLIITFFAGLITYRAWLCDDAYITFRVIDNAVNGYKLTWNTAEKVQVYTHPLWMLLQTAIYFFIRNNYLVGIFLSIILSLAALVILVFKVSKTILGGIIAALVLTLSNAYVDYSTSGLENPLTHLLLVIFFWIYFRMESGNKKLFLLSLVSSFGMVNRMDAALLFLPPMVYEFFKLEKKHWLKGFLWMAAGQLPFLAWEAFATIYYGFPFPNTAYSKITGVFPLLNVLRQGLWYFEQTLNYDLITLVIMLVAILGVLWKKIPSLYPLVISILLYLFYIFYLGGDSYLGRFFTAPLLIAAVILSRMDYAEIKQRYVLAGIAGIILLGLTAPMPVFLLEPPLRSQEVFNTTGHSRLNYSPYTRLLRNGYLNTEMDLSQEWAAAAIAAREEDPKQVIEFPSIGFFGYFAGPQVHVVDRVGLGDALIARLPPYHRGMDWWPGHLYRIVPKGYTETIKSGYANNEIKDKNLAEYFDHMNVITRGDTFSRARLSEIWRMNTGAYDHLIDFDAYRYPKSIIMPCNKSGCNQVGQPLKVKSGGIQLVFPQPVYPEEISIDLVGEGRFDVELSRDGEALLLRPYPLASKDEGKLVVGDLPSSIKNKGIDKVFIYLAVKNPSFYFEKATIQ